MPENTVSIIIEAEDRATAVIQDITTSMGQLTISAESIGEVTGYAELESRLLEMAAAADEATASVGEAGASMAGTADAVAAVGEGAGEAAGGLDEAAVAAGDTATAATEAASATKELGQSLQKDVGGGAKEATGGLDGLSSQLKGFMGMAKAGLGLWGGAQVIGQTLAFGEAGAQLINLQRGFDNAAEAAGYSGDAMLSSMMEVGRGILDDDFLMREFVLTTRMAGTEIANDWPQLMKVALASVAEGIGDAEGNLQILDQYIRTGFGRGVKMQLGLQIPDAGPVMEAYAASLGTTADRLTEAEQAQARLNAVLGAARSQFGDLDAASSQVAGGGITQLRNAWGNLIEYLQVTAGPTIDSIAGKLAGALSAGIAGTPENFSRALEGIDNVRTGLEYASQGIKAIDQGAVDEAVRRWSEAFDIGALSAENYATALSHVRAQSPQVAAEMESARVVAAEIALELGRLTPREQALAAATLAAARGFDSFRDSVLGAVSAMGGLDMGTIRGLKIEQPEGLEPQRKLYESATEYLVALDQYRADRHDEATARMEKADADLASASASNLATMQANAESYASSYESAAAGLLTPTGGGPSVEEMLAATGQRKDKWDESALRAEAVFQDYGNTAKQSWFAGWAEQVQFPVGAAEDEARAWAARYTDEFYKNMHPEDVNYAATTGGMQDIITTGQGQQDIMAQMQQGFIDAGIGMDSPEVMAAFNWAGAGTLGGTELAGALNTGLLSYDWAATAVSVSTKFHQGLVKQPSMLQSLAGDLWPYMKHLQAEDGAR